MGVLVGKKPLDDFDVETIRRAGARNSILPLAWPSYPSPAVESFAPLIQETSTNNPAHRPSMVKICFELEGFASCSKELGSEAESPREEMSMPTSPSSDSIGDATAAFWEKVRKLRQHCKRNLLSRHERSVLGEVPTIAVAGTASLCAAKTGQRESL